jgi:predicted alpha/beta-hydrolase family hydrolase
VPTRTRLVETPLGPARLIVDGARSAYATLALGHGAGGGAGARDLAALAAALPGAGITVIRVEQPWRVAGKKVAPAPATLDRGWLAALSSLTTSERRGRLVLGGRSAGARVACRTARALSAAGVVALAFPLHPPGRPERSRADELLSSGVPTVVVQGERDTFGHPDELPAGAYRTVAVPGADHGFAVPKSAALTQDEALALIVSAVGSFVASLP